MRDSFRSSLSADDWQRLSQYLDQAFDLEPAAREQWLTELATTEPDSAETLRRLLANQDALAANGFLENSPAVMLNLLAGEHAGTAGERIGAYTLVRLLGRGGMGEVWLASRSDGRFEGQCAIKFLDSIAGRGKFLERFRHEGRMLARLAHPNIARLIDAGNTDDGRQYLVLEYVDGEPIDRYCSSRSLSIEQRVRLFCDVVSAVATAHANLIIHRDLKPTNVLVTHEGTSKLLDFGIAKFLTSDLTEGDPSVTKFEEVVLTPEFAAPEQLLHELPSTATDVYQLGMLLYVLLTEQHPLTSTGSRAERTKAALEGHIPPASDLVVGEIREELRGDLDAILAMALRREPSERYATAAALREDLLRYLNHEVVAARRGAALYQVRKFIHRHRFAVAVGAGAVVGLFAVLFFALSQARVAQDERDRAYALVTRNQAVTQFLGTVITEAGASDKPVSVRDMLAESEKLAIGETEGNVENRASVLFMLATYYYNTGDTQGSLRAIDTGLEVLRDSHDSDLRAQLMCMRSVVQATLGQTDAAVLAVARQIEHLSADPLAAAECLHDRALVAIFQGDATTTLKYATAALERIRTAAHRSKSDEAVYVGTIAGAYFRMSRFRESFDYHAQALKLLAEMGRDQSQSAIAIRNNWGVASDQAGVPKQALKLFDETLRIFDLRDAQGTRPPSLLANRGRALEGIGRLSEARSAYALAIQHALRMQDKDGRVYGLLGLGDISRQEGDLAAASRYVSETAEFLRAVNEPPESIRLKRLAIAQGRVDLAFGRIEAARAQFARVKRPAHPTPTGTEAELGRAETNLRAGDTAAAIESARRALDMSTTLQGGLPWSRRTGLAWLILGKALKAQRDRAGAAKAFDSAIAHLSNTVDADQPGLVEARALKASL